MGVLLQTLRRHGTLRGRADQALQLSAPMGGDLGGGVQGEPVDAGTEGSAQERTLALGAKARANAPDLLSSPLAKGEALLHRGGHGAGQLGGVIAQGIIVGGHSRVEASLQVSQLAELAHDPMG